VFGLERAVSTRQSFAEFLDSRIRCELTQLGRSDVRAESECACLHEAIGCEGKGGGVMVQLELKLPKTRDSRVEALGC
jgi:hypothetical protein